MVEAGTTYRITSGWYRGEYITVEYISKRKFLPMASGELKTGIKAGTVINVPVSTLTSTNDKANNIRRAAQRLLKLGNKAAALKLLKQL